MLSRFNITSPHKKKYLKNTGWVFLDFILRYGINIIVGVYVARYLQPENFGLVSYSSVFYQLATPFVFLGLNAIVVRDLVKGEHEEAKIMGTAFGLKAMAAVLSFLMIMLIVQISEQNHQMKIFIAIASASALLSPLQVIDFFFQSKVQVKYVVYSQQIATVVCGAAKLLMIYYQLEPIFFVWAILIELCITSCCFVLFYKQNNYSISTWKYDAELAKTFLKEVPPVVISGFFIVIYMKIDHIMIRNMLDANSLGNYTAAVKLCEPFYVIATLITSSLYPAIVNGSKISEEEYRHRLQRLYNTLTWLAIIVSILVFVCGDYIIQLVYGSSYAESSGTLKLYFWASVFVFQGVVASQAFMIEKIQKYSTLSTLVGAIINIGLNYVFIPRYGIAGAAWATVIAYGFSATLFNAVLKPTRPIFKQQMLAFSAIITKPKGLINQFYDRKDNSNKIS